MIPGVIACNHYHNKDRQLAILISYLNRNYAIMICTIFDTFMSRVNMVGQTIYYIWAFLPGVKKKEIFISNSIIKRSNRQTSPFDTER